MHYNMQSAGKDDQNESLLYVCADEYYVHAK